MFRSEPFRDDEHCFRSRTRFFLLREDSVQRDGGLYG